MDVGFEFCVQDLINLLVRADPREGVERLGPHLYPYYPQGLNKSFDAQNLQRILPQNPAQTRLRPKICRHRE